MHINTYYIRERVQQAVREGQHRSFVGGLWDEIGRLQFEFLVQRGLTPDMKLLDIGCGCLRGGVHFVGYLESRRYYGMDISQELLDVGYDIELAAVGLQNRLPREHLICDAEFRFERFGECVDMALAQSVFTHLPFNHIRLCLGRLAPAMKVGATLYATFFICEDDQGWSGLIEHADGLVTSRPAQDPFHYRFADIEFLASELPFTAERIPWEHPRGQSMVAFKRTDG